MISRGLKERFIERVKKQAVLYGELKEVMAQEERSLMSKDVNALDKAVKKEDDIVNSIQSEEAAKNVLFNEMAAAAGITAGPELKLKDLLESMAEADAKEVEKAVIDLIETVRIIGDANSKNLHVIKNFVEYVDFAKTMKDKIQNPSTAVYDAKGFKKDSQPQNRLNIDKKI